MAYQFKIKKENGSNADEIFPQFRNIYNLLQNGEYTVRIEKYVVKRSTSQNSLMWMWFQCIADSFNEQSPDTRYTSRDIYDYFTYKFLRNEHQIGDEWITTIRKTSSLKTDEFAVFLNSIQSYAITEFGIRLPSPDDLHFAEFYEQYKKYEQ